MAYVPLAQFESPPPIDVHSVLERTVFESPPRIALNCPAMIFKYPPTIDEKFGSGLLKDEIRFFAPPPINSNPSSTQFESPPTMELPSSPAYGGTIGIIGSRSPFPEPIIL